MQLAEKQVKDQALTRMVLQVKQTAARLGMGARQAEVYLSIDTSGSMNEHYRSGRVQEIVERMLAIALGFDNDGEIRVIAFGSQPEDCGVVTKANYHECVKYNSNGTVTINGKNIRLSGTNYAPAFEAVLQDAFGTDWENMNTGGSKGFFGFGSKKGGRPCITTPIDNPIFHLFVTDGECSDRREALAIVDKSSKLPMFTQFAGFGSGFSTLDQIDNMEGRHVDNAGVFTASSLGITDQQLFDGMLNEFPDWLRATANEGWYK